MISGQAAGALWILFSCVVSCLFEVYLGSIARRLDPVAVNTACCGAIACGHFAWELGRNGKGFLAKLKSDWRDLIGFNVSSLFATVMMVLCFRWLEPSAGKAILASVGPVFTLFFGPWLLGSMSASPRTRLAVAGTAGASGLMIWGALTGASGIGGVSASEALLGVLAALASGLAVVFMFLYMKKFERKGWSISEMLASRFLLLVAAGAFLWPETGSPGAPGLADLPALAAVAVGWIWVPVFSFQWGLKKSDSVTASLIVAASPLLTLVFQVFDSNLMYSSVTVAAVSLNTAAAVFGQWPGVPRDTVFKVAKTGLK